MNRRLVIESSDEGRREIDYSALSAKEIREQLGRYEKKYGMAFAQYDKQFSCDSATPQEMTDFMDWENLMAERKARRKKALTYDLR